MRRALALAALGRGTVSPNPLVGAVVARGPRVVGQGYHRRPGEPHAEVIALAEAGARAEGATLYTNLEPCCHTGRTPPCAEEIIRAGVRKVVTAMRDPNPRVDGGGIRSLRQNGVRVDVGLHEEEAEELNRAFVKLITTGLPWVTIKAGTSLDGRIATSTGRSKWITSAEAREHARRLRLENDAIMVGIGTVLADDPRLGPTARRSPHSKRILRVIMDRRLRFPPRSRLARTLREGPVLVFAGAAAPAPKRRQLERLGVEVDVLPLENGRLHLGEALRRLASREIGCLLVEGGGELNAAFVERRLADRLVLYVAPKLIGGRDAPSFVSGEGARTPAAATVVVLRSCVRVGEELLLESDFV